MWGKFFIVTMMIGVPFCQLCSQKPVVVVESTLKIAPFKEEVFYYGFAAGDKLIFNFEEANNKELKEVEITELPSSTKFMEYKIKSIENKTIDIINTGIYKFRFANSAILPKVCKFSIQRVPANNATQNFNTTVYTRSVNDTIYTTDDEDYIDRTDTVITNFQDRTVRLNPAADGTGYKSTFNFVLPDYTIAWAYYIYTDEAGKKTYDDASKKMGVYKPKNISGFYTPLAAEILNTNSHLKKIEAASPVNFWIVDRENADLFMKGAQFRFMKKGTASADYARMAYRKGTLHFCFSTGTSTQPATITVKIAAVHVNEEIKTRKIQRILSIQPKSEMYLKN
jgi:hypothetical protein